MIKNLEIRKLNKILKRVNSYKDHMKKMSDEKLKALTSEFKQRFKSGESLDDLLPEAYAAIREAAFRVIGLFAYDVQIMGAIVLHQGEIAEMKTGEGKTLAAIFPAYLNSISGEGVIVITSNEYLAKRDASEMRGVFNFMGVTIMVDAGDGEKDIQFKKRLYNSDILYTTQANLGFDYLIDNLAQDNENKFLRKFNYVIIDEIDSVLLDSAQMPLIISGSPKVQSNLYKTVQNFITTLVENIDYDTDEEEHVWFTDKGIKKAEQFFFVENLFDDSNFYLVKILNLVLKANVNFKREKDYIVKDKKIKLLDKENGRVMEGITLKNGQHQALEAKEGLDISMENRAIASITYQNLFKLFKKISGMSGTVKVAEPEFLETYGLKVICIPTNKPIKRDDKKDKIYATLPEKVVAILDYVKKIHEKEQPLLIVSGSVQATELFSTLLLDSGIAHSVLNAHNAAKEAEIISEAGKRNNVTVATTMAGRGTDIKITNDVIELGGLVVIGTEKMPSKRVDQQLRGRSGRQGEPGISQFFISLEDELLVKHGPTSLDKYRNKTFSKIEEIRPKKLNRRKFSRVVELAQQASDDNARNRRNNISQYDESIKVQRTKIYEARNKLISGESIDIDIDKIIKYLVEDFVKANKDITTTNVKNFLIHTINYFSADIAKIENITSKKELSTYLYNTIHNGLEEVQKILISNKEKEDFIRIAVLKAIDEHWVEQIDTLSMLSTVVSGRSYAQKNTIYEYTIEAYESYNNMRHRIKQTIIKNLISSYIKREENGEITIFFP